MRQATNRLFGIVAATALSLSMAGCSAAPRQTEESGESTQPATQPATEEAGEHAGGDGERSEGGEEHARSERGGEHDEGGHDEEREGEGGEGEESGVYIGRGDTWDVVRRGARLVLAFDPAANAFVGTVENTTEATLCAVRVEVHLAGGIELGPTERIDVRPGARTRIVLPTEGQSFETWTAHPETSGC